LNRLLLAALQTVQQSGVPPFGADAEQRIGSVSSWFCRVVAELAELAELLEPFVACGAPNG
jgi:hypothetical protein